MFLNWTKTHDDRYQAEVEVEGGFARVFLDPDQYHALMVVSGQTRLAMENLMSEHVATAVLSVDPGDTGRFEGHSDGTLRKGYIH